MPPDLLQRIAGGDARLAGLSPADYHLAKGERLNEQVNRAWNRLIGVWAGFRSGMDTFEARDQGTTLSRERWLLHLFQELGYGRLLVSRSAREIEGKTYPVSHFWQRTPIHLLGFRVDLDRRTPGVIGAAQANPHSMLQEYLNRSPDALWGFLSNGLYLRILRDNVSLVRPAYIEFDLQAMMEGEIYSDFVLLWLLCHQSRVEAEKPQDCWLEKWYNTAREQGSRALDQLRDGVAGAIAALGPRFRPTPPTEICGIGSPRRPDKQDYYASCSAWSTALYSFCRRRPGAPPAARCAADRKERYLASLMRRLRSLAAKQRHETCRPVQGAAVVMISCMRAKRLALPALGSYLWSRPAVADLIECDISNEHFLQGACLAFYVSSGVRLPVDYRNLGTEELGSVYESLLELHPQLNLKRASLP